MEQYAKIQQILKKEEGQKERKPIYPPTVIQAVFDANTGASLEAILAQFNSIYVQYQGTPKATRCIIPEEMRRAGLTITYMNMDSETITERAASAVQKDNEHWGLDINWSRVDELSLSGDISVSAQGTWIINGEDTGIKALGPKGDAGLTPWLKTIDNRLHFSYDNVNWEPCSEPIAAYFRFNATSGNTQSGTIGKIQISRDNKTWNDLSPEFTNHLHIAGYVATTSALPANKPVGTIYGVGPTYAAEDTDQTNPIYRIYVYNGTTWVDNGLFTSIAAGIVQETGDSETEVMSQKATTEKLTELASILGGKYTIVDKTTEVKSTMTDSYINYFDGTKVNSSSVKSSDYVNIQGFERLIITLGVTTESWTNVGLAFYSSADESSYISGVGFDVNAPSTGYVTKQLDVPHGAMYFRTSIYRQNIEDFSCRYIKVVEKGHLDLLDDDVLELNERVEDINDEINRIESHPTMDEVIKTDSKTTSTASHDTKINLSVGVRYDIKAKTDTISSGGTDSKIGVYYMHGDSLEKIYTCTAENLFNGISFEYTPTQDGHLEIRTMEAGTRYHISATYKKLISEKIDLIEDLYITQKKDGASVTTGVDGNELFTLKPNKKYSIYVKTATIVSSPGASLGLWITDPNSDLGVSALFVCTSQELYQGITFEYTPSIESILYLRTYEKGTEYFASISYIFRNEDLFEMANHNSNNIEKLKNEIEVINNWKDKNVVVYGDSITAQGNGDNAECVNSYFYPAYKKFGFKNLYVRGIGGQTYMWNTGGYYSAVGSNGKYLNRYNFDSEGNQLSTTVSPIRTTAEEKANIESFYGKSIEIHYGAFCSWDRITSMIPSDIRESIDLIIVCGGTNDHSHIEEIIVDGEIAANEPIWKPNDITDPTWGASSMYLGGDYDINTLSGAIASTVMKMQTWCPNAVVVVATPFPAFDTTTKQQLINNAGLSFRNLCKIETDVAGMIGIDAIDANGKCGINGANFYLYQTDGTHPNAEGRKMYSRVFNGELNRIATKEK